MTEPTLDAGVTTDIYPMPAFTTLVVADLDRTVDFYTNALDFVVLFTMPGGTLVHLRRWRYQDILVRPGDAGPGAGATLGLASVAEELPALAEKARAHGGGTVEDRWTRRGTPATSTSPTPTGTASSTPPGGRPVSGTPSSRR